MWRALLMLSLMITFLITPTAAQEPSQILTMDKAMTPKERQETGVASLSRAQRDALNRWLNAYTMKVLEAARTVPEQPGPLRTPGLLCTPDQVITRLALVIG